MTNAANSSWDNLSTDQREQILKSYEESEDEANLITHDEVMKQYDKWLGIDSRQQPANQKL